MQLRIMTEPQEGATYDDLAAVAQEGERLGFDAFFRSDHLLAIGDPNPHRGPGPGSTETWATLAGLARDTSRIRLGTMVSSATFRLPGMLALSVATVDAMSGGRVELGLGGGWYEREHAAFGIPYPGVGERFDRLQEQLEILTGLWATAPGESFSYQGQHHSLIDNPALPRPVQARVPIIIGGRGRRRTPELAVRFAAEYNVPPGSTLEDAAACVARVREACERAERDPGTLALSAVQTLAIGADGSAARDRAAAAGVDPGAKNALAGTVDQVVERIGRFVELGVSRLYLQFMSVPTPAVIDQLGLVAAEVVPAI